MVVLTDEVVQKIVRIVEHADFTLKQTQQKLQEDAIMVSTSSIARALHGQVITTKKLEDATAPGSKMQDEIMQIGTCKLVHLQR